MKAIILGATGLVGSHMLQEVLADDFFDEIVIFVRRSTGITHPRLKEVISSMMDIASLQDEIKGDVIFNALGTTIKSAGSKAEQQRIDRDLPMAFARIGSHNGVKIMLNVSSVGASMNGGFYLRTKAEMENGTKQYFPTGVHHFRPGMLTGKRQEFRFFERVAKGAMKLIDPLLVGDRMKYRSMPAGKLARAMVLLSKNEAGKPEVLHYPEIMKLLE